MILTRHGLGPRSPTHSLYKTHSFGCTGPPFNISPQSSLGMAASLPPLPKIEGDVDLFLDVFTHNSLRMQSAPMNEEYGNTDRLAVLGATVLRLAIATHFFRKKPQLSAEDIEKEIDKNLSDDIVDKWMNQYNLKTKLRIAPSEMKRIGDVKEMRKVFETYVGALYIRNGLHAVQPWISRLIDPNAMVEEPTVVVPPSSARTYAPIPPPSSAGSSRTTSSMSYQPAPPKSPPPPIPPPYSMGSSSSQFQAAGSQNSSMYNMVTVALMNQKASQMGYQVTYPAEHTGPPHNPIWTVRCCLNNREYGRGTGKSQKIAKDEAARKTWAAMGW